MCVCCLLMKERWWFSVAYNYIQACLRRPVKPAKGAGLLCTCQFYVPKINYSHAFLIFPLPSLIRISYN